MAIAGGTSPCLRLTYDRDLNVIVIHHAENRLIRVQVPALDANGNVVLNAKGEPKTTTVPTGAAELNMDQAWKKLKGDDPEYTKEAVWVRSMDRVELVRVSGVQTCPAPMLYRIRGEQSGQLQSEVKDKSEGMGTDRSVESGQGPD